MFNIDAENYAAMAEEASINEATDSQFDKEMEAQGFIRTGNNPIKGTGSVWTCPCPPSFDGCDHLPF